MKIEANYSVAQDKGLFCIQRNERQLMTPAGNAYATSKEALATAIMEEWQAQGDKVVPATMPLTQLLATTLDITFKAKEKTQDALIAYIPTELLCYRAERPDRLVEKQKQIWQPYLDWCEETYGVHYNTGTGLMPIAQEDSTTEKLSEVIRSYDEMKLTALSNATDCSGSLVLGLALIERFKGADDIFEACELDTHDQVERWGEDPVTTERHKKMKFELDACERWMKLI